MAGHITIQTLGDLADNGIGLSFHCDDCGRFLDITLDQAIRLWGRDQVYVKWRPTGIKCAGCDGRKISLRLGAVERRP